MTTRPTYPAALALQWIDGTGHYRDISPGWYPIHPPIICEARPWDVGGRWPAEPIAPPALELEIQ